MRTLIVPCAGNREIDGCPLFLMKYPDNELIAIKAIQGVYPKNYDKIIYTILKEVEDEYSAIEKIKKANNGRYNIEFVLLSEKTNGPADTVYKTLVEANVEGEFAVRDSHAYIATKKAYVGNFVAGLDLTLYEKTIENLRSKSFMKINEQGQILDIVEKHFTSDIISAGLYGFKDATDYKLAYEHLCDDNYGIEKLYLSHVISYLIGYKRRVFHRAKVLEFEDWATESAWQKVQKTHAICFIDICLAENQINELLKLSIEGVNFIIISNAVINEAQIRQMKERGVKVLGAISSCPVSTIKIVINKKSDLEKLLLDI